MANTTGPIPDYAPPVSLLRNRLLHRLALTVGAVFAVAYVALAIFKPSGHGEMYICKNCGIMQSTVDYYLPLTHITIYRSRSWVPTSISSTLAKHALRINHSHNLVYVNGGLFGLERSCELSGDRQLLQVVNDPMAASLVDQLSSNADAQSRDQWIDLLLNPATSLRTRDAIWDSGLPIGGFAKQLDFQAWWNSQGQRMSITVQHQSTNPSP